MPQGTNLSFNIPEWICNSISAKLDNPGLMDKGKICMYRSYNSLTAKSQIIAYVNTDKFDGAFIIFEDYNGEYREIYATKVKLIMSTRILNPDIVLSCMDSSGTGTATTNFHLIKNTPNGYKDIWQGLANYYDFNGNPQFNYNITASMNFSCSGELIHSILKRVYTKENHSYPVQVEKFTDVYMYDNNYMQYRLINRY